MISAAISFFALAIVAYIVGAYGIAGISMEVGKVFLFIFLILAIISTITAVASGRRPKSIL
jgi:uncharacterized membrane protein YtjA (UPF0391 family)